MHIKNRNAFHLTKKERKGGGRWTGGNAKTNVGGGAYTIQTIMLKMGEFSSQASCCFGTEGILDRIAGCQEYFWSLLAYYPGLNHLYILSIYSQKNDI